MVYTFFIYLFCMIMIKIDFGLEALVISEAPPSQFYPFPIPSTSLSKTLLGHTNTISNINNVSSTTTWYCAAPCASLFSGMNVATVTSPSTPAVLSSRCVYLWSFDVYQYLIHPTHYRVHILRYRHYHTSNITSCHFNTPSVLQY